MAASPLPTQVQRQLFIQTKSPYQETLQTLPKSIFFNQKIVIRQQKSAMLCRMELEFGQKKSLD